jgi:hypothetical protein
MSSLCQKQSRIIVSIDRDDVLDAAGAPYQLTISETEQCTLEH